MMDTTNILTLNIFSDEDTKLIVAEVTVCPMDSSTGESDTTRTQKLRLTDFTLTGSQYPMEISRSIIISGDIRQQIINRNIFNL